MAVKRGDIAVILTERIEASHPAPALFTTAETDEWPARILEHLLGCGILQQAHRAGSTLCPGCEWQCHKTVVVRTTSPGPRPQAFITCDEEPDHGRITVPLRSLIQYGATLAGLSSFIAGMTKLGPLRSSPTGASFLLGTIKGRHGLRQSLPQPDRRTASAAGRPTAREHRPNSALGRRPPVD